MIGNYITEEEIQNHKNKLKNLITKLINTHNIDEEILINNEIKNETEFLSSLFKIKKNELNQNNNNMNINPMQQQMGQMMGNNDMDMQQQMMQQQMIQQQMMQQQMMHQQMMEAQAAQAQQVAMQKILNERGISVVFTQSDYSGREPIWIYCYPEQKVSSIIDQYRSESDDHDPFKKFIFNAKNLSPNLTVAEAGILNRANIYVVPSKISVAFRQSDLSKRETIWIYGCYPEQKVSSIIEQYRSKSGDHDPSKKFIFNAKNLSPNLTLAEAGISNGANIFVVSTK